MASNELELLPTVNESIDIVGGLNTLDITATITANINNAEIEMEITRHSTETATEDNFQNQESNINSNCNINCNITKDMDIEAKLRELLNGRSNHAKWVALIELYNIICNYGGLIFGGATRDYIKRTLAAKKFYEFYNSTLDSKNGNKEKKECKNNCKKEYNNKEYHPESFEDRTLLPNDVDVYIKEDSYEELVKILQTIYDVKNSMGKDDICYFFKQNKLFTDALEFRRYYINFLQPCSDKLFKLLVNDTIDDSNLLRIKIDFIVLKKSFYENYEAKDGGLLYPPFGNPDFDINQVGMYSINNNIEIKIFNSLLRFYYTELYNSSAINPLEYMDIKYKAQLELFSNIEHSIAVPLYPHIQQVKLIFGADYKPQINVWRLRKIYNKGYIINSEKTLGLIKPIKYSLDDFIHNEEDKCIICLDIFSKNKKWFQFGCICNVKMHLECYAKYIRKPTLNEYNSILCPHCREPNSRECPCALMNFMSSINHRFRLLDDNSSNDKCLDKDNSCTKWYYKCKCCDI
jgi:hypothetical protein